MHGAVFQVKAPTKRPFFWSGDQSRHGPEGITPADVAEDDGLPFPIYAPWEAERLGNWVLTVNTLIFVA